MKFALILAIIISNQVFAYDFSMKGSYGSTSTSNVNSSNTNVTSDTYSILNAQLQAKNQYHKFKFKFKAEKYQKTTTDDNNYMDLGYAYKETPDREYTFDAFRTKYTQTPTIKTDTSSDNSGGKLGVNFSKQYSKDQSGYINLSGTYKNYVNIATRKDTIVDATFGYENYVSSNFSITPEFNFEYNKSKDSYYSNMNLGPALYLNFTPTDALEFFINGTLLYTNYNNRTFQETVKNRTITNKEHQTLVTTEIGAILTLFDKVPLQAKYTTNKNSSNNSASAYDSHLFSFGVGLKF